MISMIWNNVITKWSKTTKIKISIITTSYSFFQEYNVVYLHLLSFYTQFSFWNINNFFSFTNSSDCKKRINCLQAKAKHCNFIFSSTFCFVDMNFLTGTLVHYIDYNYYTPQMCKLRYLIYFINQTSTSSEYKFSLLSNITYFWSWF